MTTEDTENTEILLPYLQVSNQDLRGLCVLRGRNSSIHEPIPAAFAAPKEKRTWTSPSLIAVGVRPKLHSCKAARSVADSVCCPMNTSKIKNPKAASYLSRIRIEHSKPSSMTSAEFYRQMENRWG